MNNLSSSLITTSCQWNYKSLSDRTHLENSSTESLRIHQSTKRFYYEKVNLPVHYILSGSQINNNTHISITKLYVFFHENNMRL